MSSLQDELFVLGREMLCQRHIEAIIRERFMLMGESVHSRTEHHVFKGWQSVLMACNFP